MHIFDAVKKKSYEKVIYINMFDRSYNFMSK